MILSVANIQKMVAEGLINDDFFISILNKKDLPKDLYEKLSIGFPWGEWLRSARKIESLAKEYDFFDRYNIVTQKYELVNLFYFFPDIAVTLPYSISSDILNTKIENIIRLLDNSYVNKYLLTLILKEKINADQIDTYVFLLLAGKKHKLLDKNSEANLLKKIIDVLDKNSFFYTFLSKRLSSLNKQNESVDIKSEVTDKPRVALIISGQIRYPTSTVSQVIESILKNSSINISEIFIASWSNIGGYSFLPNKFSRHLDEKVLKLVQEGKVCIEELISKAKSSSSFNNEPNLFDFLKWVNIPIRIKLNKESEYPYNRMYNSEKMYFNNAYWIETLGDKYFTDNFDMIIKVRPDINIENFETNLSNLNSGFIWAEMDWIFRQWGFGIGDQFILGKTKDIIPLLTTHNDLMVKTFVDKFYPKSACYTGHVNIGISAWLEGLEVERAPKLKYNFVYPPIFSLSDLGLVGE